MLSYLRYLNPFNILQTEENDSSKSNTNTNTNTTYEDKTPDTIIQIDPNNMSIDLESGYLILVTHLSD